MTDDLVHDGTPSEAGQMPPTKGPEEPASDGPTSDGKKSKPKSNQSKSKSKSNQSKSGRGKKEKGAPQRVQWRDTNGEHIVYEATPNGIECWYNGEALLHLSETDDYNLAKHPDVEEASNLEVIKLMTSLTSKDLVSCRFSWKHYYWFLNDEGIEWLREYLHLPADMVPNTLKKAAASKPPQPPGRGDGDRPPRPPREGGGFGRGDREGYRSGGGDGPPRGFGRGAPRPPAA